MLKGSRKGETMKTIAELEKRYRKTKKAIWIDLAERLKASRRQRASVNLWKLEKLSETLKGKTIVVPGKVLGTGELKEKVKVVALEYSGNARKKIGEKGEAFTFLEAMKKEISPSTMVIVE